MSRDPRNVFPDINEIARARATFARTNRANALAPGDVERQGLVNRGVGQQNQLRQFDIGTEERKVAGAEQLTELRGSLQRGDEGSARTFAIQRPEEFKRIIAAQAAGRKLSQDKYDAGVLQIARGATSVLRMAADGASPEDVQKAHTTIRESIMRRNSDMKPEDIPEKFSAEFAKSAIDFGSGIAELRKAAGLGPNQLTTVGVPGQPGAEQPALINRFTGRTRKVGDPLVPAPGKGGGGGRGGGGDRLPTGVSNTILRTVNQLFGDIFDLQNDRIQILDPAKRREMLAVASRAEQLASTQGLGPIEAVEAAALELDIPIPKLGGKERSVSRDRPGAPSEVRDKQLKAMADFVDKLE